MQPEKLSEVRSWLKKAAGDLRGADIDLAASPPFIEDMLFHCQQAAEKSMKGFLTAHDRVFRKTHDLDELASACEAVDPTLKEFLNPARDLTVFAWEFRYPGEAETPSMEEARQFRGVAGEVYQAILTRLPQEAHP
ncbi:MAG: HEPN domain-containing protein [Syntrophobacterales bacterium]|jgi:HEPN domain-containing protein|nr:HEPN domain-containing protein [Syntrophobacterales bacterium]